MSSGRKPNVKTGRVMYYDSLTGWPKVKITKVHTLAKKYAVADAVIIEQRDSAWFPGEFLIEFPQYYFYTKKEKDETEALKDS